MDEKVFLDRPTKHTIRRNLSNENLQRRGWSLAISGPWAWALMGFCKKPAHG
jgi:hypothetical protein